MRQSRLSVVLLTLLALAIVYGVGTTSFNVEIERLIERTLTPRIVASPGVERLNREIYSGMDRFMRSRRVRLIGCGCFGVMIALAIVGLVTERKGLVSLGSIGFVLPIYAYFVIHMSFLAGLGILAALWAPFWGDLVRLGDIVYLPYVALAYPLSLVGVDIRLPLVGLLVSLGLPLPGCVCRAVAAPFRLVLRKDRPTTRWDLIGVFILYLVIIILLSLPFVLLNWPASGGWAAWLSA